ncbi:tetratricopeptide repeat protein [Flavobacterium xanthum]|uniref:Tetratricopeptide repeat-containing protein n=1 Tax=Flavobacterium xanthum TaxID=69322 RepID=A0A1M7IUT3_9FLAO|nr:tetratricopeptide repeat protein [Flavobacterium xanthum]SHM44500.1 Tetratricopeptide repeat-containing protein [Flavobacterium xanthum]
MQIIHKINDFFFTLFPDLTSDNKEVITAAMKKQYTYGPFVPTVTLQEDLVIIDVDTETIITQDADYNKTVALCDKGKFDEARAILEKLIEKNPTNSEFHRILGQILSEQGDQDESINALIDSLRWNSSNGWALMMMGNIFARHKNDVTTALKYYDQAILANKADHITLANIAYLLLQENKLEDAKKYAYEAIKLKDNYPNTSFILSLIAEKENDLQSAFYSTIQAIKQSTNEEALYQNALKQAFDLANKIASDSDGEKLFKTYRSQLEDQGGIEIDIFEDNEIQTAAKIEFAERHNRDKHIVKYKSTYPAVEHLVMHELVHLDFVIQARKENLNQVFLSTQKNKQDFLTTIQPTIQKLKSMGVEQTMVTKFTDGVFNGINLQTYNTPIDVFIEDLLHKEHTELRSYQFLSLFNLLQEAIKSVTDERVLDIAPQSVLSKTKTYSLVNAIQFKELFGIDCIPEFKASTAELKQAQSFYKEFSEIKDDRKPGQEFELVKHWAQELGLDPFFELESETKFETKNNIDDFLTKLQQDPFGLDEEEDPLEKKEMEKFQKHQEEMGTNMAIVMFMVDALKYFKNKAAEDIKQTALEIAMLGTMGIDPNKKEYIIASITGKRFSGNQVLAYYYVSWAIAMPEQVQHLGLDFKNEFEMAKKTI